MQNETLAVSSTINNKDPVSIKCPHCGTAGRTDEACPGCGKA